MRALKTFTMKLGVGIGVVYLFFLIPSIEALFDPKFMLAVRQGLILSFAVSLLFNYEYIINTGMRLAPKILAIMNILFGVKNKDNESNS